MEIFIGSSSESQHWLRRIERCLRNAEAEPLPWDKDGCFPVGEVTLQSLVDITEQVDGAVLVFTADDRVEHDEARVYRQPRDNVVFEFGLFAGRLGLKRAIICHDGQAKVPVDLNGLTPIDLSQPDWQKRLTNWVRGLEGPFQRDIAGIVKVWSDFRTAKFQELLTKAKEINILQTFIPETGHLSVLYKPLIEAINRGCQVQVLITHHRSKVIEIRRKALAEAKRQTDVHKAVHNNVRMFGDIYRELRSERKKALKVRAYTTLPSMCIYQADDTFFFGCYFHGKLAIEGLQTRVEGRGTLWGEALRDEFAKVWGHEGTTEVNLRDPENWLRL